MRLRAFMSACSLLAGLPAPLIAAAPPADWTPQEALVLELEGVPQRLPLAADGLLFEWAVQNLDPDAPVLEGDSLGTGGASGQWTPVKAGPKGGIAARRGAWVLMSFDSAEGFDGLLDPGPSAAVFFNGQPRAADPYHAGYLQHPVRVRQGRNGLLIKARGTVRPSIRPAPSSVVISQRDRTLPDVRLGEPLDAWAGLVVLNASAAPLTGAAVRAIGPDGEQSTSPIPALEPYSSTKAPFQVRGAAPVAGTPYDVVFEVIGPQGAVLATQRASLPVRSPEEPFSRTYLSEIDGSVQYYGMREAVGAGDGEPRGLIVSLHGAGVEASGQIRHYSPQAWAHIIATTNRRPYGFDHEDWGRVDMLEAMADVESRYAIDEDRVHLTGHSMGGHGTWINGLLDADRFASIGPSSGWASFWTYGGAERLADTGGVSTILRRAANVSDSLLLIDNAARIGVYILHSQNDQTVPVREARQMRARLAEFHPDWAYYERPEAGHWWGSECLDWPPMLAFFRDRTRRSPSLSFTTVDPHLPGVKTRGVTILAQQVTRMPSRVRLEQGEEDGVHIWRGTTQNVALLAIDPPSLVRGTAGGCRLELDGTVLPVAGEEPLVLERDGQRWTATQDLPLLRKSSRLPSGFKSVFAHRPFLVYGTAGDAAERTWSRDKARFDAETFHYRGNGRFEVLSDADYLKLPPAARAGRNVVLYGCADTNLAWQDVMPETAPFEIRRGSVRIGPRRLAGDDFGLVACLPAADAGRLVGVVAGTGEAGRRTTTPVRFFLSGAHLPDWTLLTPQVLAKGWEAVYACGFFDNEWRYDESQSGWPGASRADPP